MNYKAINWAIDSQLFGHNALLDHEEVYDYSCHPQYLVAILAQMREVFPRYNFSLETGYYRFYRDGKDYPYRATARIMPPGERYFKIVGTTYGSTLPACVCLLALQLLGAKEDYIEELMFGESR